jgi:hypothetical protein
MCEWVPSCRQAGGFVLVLTVAVLAVTSSAAVEPAAGGASATATAGDVEPLDFLRAPILDLEAIGRPSVTVWIRELPAGRADDAAPWKQLISFKNHPRTYRECRFAVVDFAAGTVRVLPVAVPAMQAWSSLWVGGKQYIGTNLPARLLVFDPKTESLTDLGECFRDRSLTAYSLAAAPDGTIVIGGGTGSDVTLYDPATDRFEQFGQVAREPGGGTYAYTVSASGKSVYAAVRSSDPWELVRIDRATKARSVLATAPPERHMSVNGPRAEIAGAGGPKQWFALGDDRAVEWARSEESGQQQILVAPEDRPVPWDVPGPGFTGTAPRIVIDESPALAGRKQVTVHVESPAGDWREAPLPLEPDPECGGVIPLAMDDGRIAAAVGKYFPQLVVDPRTGDTQLVPMHVSCYGHLPVGSRIFFTGYPSTPLFAFDTSRPRTSTLELPGRPAVSQESPAANPTLVAHIGGQTGGAHVGMMLTKAADDHVYMIARRHRYFYGFDLVRFDPRPDESGRYRVEVCDDGGAFDHLQIAAMQPADEGRKLVIATEVQYNKQISGTAPASAAVLVWDVTATRIVGRHEPLPGATKIDVAAMPEPDVLVGCATGFKDPGSATLFRYRTGSATLDRVRHVNHSLGKDLAPAGDGRLWGTVDWGNHGVIFTVDPTDLAVAPVARSEDSRQLSLAFLDGKTYVGGYPTVMRARNVPAP